MRSLDDYSSPEWLKGHPLRDFLKQIRNDLVLKHYVNSGKDIDYVHHEKINEKSPIIISIAFNKPEIIELLINKFKINVIGATLLIADNSNDLQKRSEIKNICRREKIPYLPLPYNKTKHANRSHSMAMQWCYERLIKKIKPEIFGFIDHDLIPLKSFNIQEKIGNQAFYGLRWVSKKPSSWQLWAGYCFFRYPSVSALSLNFLYDFSNGLDTGGRNYWKLYFNFEADECDLAKHHIFEGQIESKKETIERIDQQWLHLGGAGHRKNFEKRLLHFESLIEHFEHNDITALEQQGFSCIN